jgi:hypothetical protein
MWKDTRAFSQQMIAAGKPIHFTYFISGVYFITEANKTLYLPPKEAPGTSKIGYGDSSTDIASRLEQMNLAIQEGQELGSHANGHFSGTTWDYKDWKQEFRAFTFLTTNVSLNNLLQQEPTQRQQLKLPAKGFAGFRAPELGISAPLWQVLKEEGYRYDASHNGSPQNWPTQNANGIWSIPLARIPFAGSGKPILSMDYNFYFKQTDATDKAKKGSAAWKQYYKEMLTSYQQYFTSNYDGTRAPIVIGHHFSLWNDGVYWEVMKAFAQEVCGKPDVRCVTFSELTDYLDAQEKPKTTKQ